jgi:hypothetical protein
MSEHVISYLSLSPCRPDLTCLTLQYLRTQLALLRLARFFQIYMMTFARPLGTAGETDRQFRLTGATVVPLFI